MMSPEETSFVFARPAALALLLLLPLLALLRSRSGREGSVRFSSLHILARLGPAAKGRAGALRAAVILLTLACLALALARPQLLNHLEEIHESGVEVILAIDVSRSMQVEDFVIDGTRVNRLQAAKKVARDFIRARRSDRIGIIAFAGRPYLASPMTLSTSWLEGPNGLGRVRIGLVEDGTAIGSAIAASARRLDKREARSKVIVLLTDGVNNAGQISPVEAAQLARTLGIRIHSIAVGTYGDFIVQTPAGPQRLQQEFDEENLREIARIGGGEYFRAQDTEALEGIFERIDEMETSETTVRYVAEAYELHPWFALAGLLFGLLSVVGGETFWRRFP